ncbi:putative sugar phosphatase [Trypanosoma grayi]|uniref:putative sugar phosphatase n=1 Tax=Trypanosoma grayi TaxID=71804 RepID=UPI0004F4117D|nr:putative sugar phosphatase [Trypanosoma grayi]KEG15347.1 putative sugar phosphatase [Trypanosoma grayi]
MADSPIPFKVVATDLDGTLLNPCHSVSEYTRRVINALINKGVPVVFATGRHHGDVLETKRKLGLKGYTITSNGARVHDPQNRVILEKNIESSIARELALLAINEEDIVTSIYRKDSWLVNKDATALAEYFKANKDVFCYQLFNPVEEKDYDEVYKVYFTSDRRASLDALSDKIAATYGDKVSITMSLPNCLEVMKKGVNKGAALREVVSRILGNGDENAGGVATTEAASTIKHCIAFGDGLNDVEMLNMAEKGCLMENAQKELLSVAPSHLEIIGRNSEDGVAKYLANLFKLNVDA